MQISKQLSFTFSRFVVTACFFSVGFFFDRRQRDGTALNRILFLCVFYDEDVESQVFVVYRRWRTCYYGMMDIGMTGAFFFSDFYQFGSIRWNYHVYIFAISSVLYALLFLIDLANRFYICNLPTETWSINAANQLNHAHAFRCVLFFRSRLCFFGIIDFIFKFNKEKKG